MSLDNMNMGDFDVEKAQYDRLNRTSPPEYAPGQDTDELFSNDVTQPTGTVDGGNGTFVNGYNSGTSNFQFNTNPAQQAQAPKKDYEDMAIDAAIKGAKESAFFIKELVSSLDKLTPMFWSEWGENVMKVGIAFLGGGLVLRFLGLGIGMSLAIGGTIACIPGSFCWLFLQDKARACSSRYTDDNDERSTDGGDESDPFGSIEPEQSMSFGDDFEDEDDPSFFIGDEEESYEEDEDDFDFDFKESKQEIKNVSIEDSLDNLQVIDKGMYTRQYLYEVFTRVMPSYSPDFYTNREYDEDDEVFLNWEDNLRQAASVTGVAEEYLPTLESIKENLFTVELKCDRPKGFKPEAVAQELASIYSYMDGRDDIVSYDVRPVGTSCFIRLFTGNNAMISLRDMFKQSEKFMLDTNNTIPVTIGVDSEGKVLSVDLKKVESMLVAGMPRSGKTWFVLTLIYQMCAFCSPKDINFYILDPKAGISDYRNIKIPHVKLFEQSYDGTLDFLRKVVKVEGAKRKKILGDAGCVKIWDFKEKYPDVELPVIYVIIDEMVSFSGNLDKETKQEFRALLRELISQLPALGIRAILIPHVVKDEFIEKTTSELIMCRISVRGEPEHVEKSTGAKPKDFKHKLTNMGDMAVLMKEVNPSTIFVKAPVLTKSPNETSDLFDYQRRVWAKLEPETIKDSVAFDADFDKEQQELLKGFEVDDSIDENILF